ncbi:hypothetical protein J1605_003407 [Eschrichtius robustus]|uniref:Uncharacterized protein n=1 Tax=Eschrichtius robustus TaxID=9764 RepID=A0AB34HMA4_ESCRO|nr:hypothetical protein J1605_003407 [Eschrichtius robustus]
MLGFIPAGRELLSSDAMTEYSRARVYLDEDYKSQEHFTVSALPSVEPVSALPSVELVSALPSVELVSALPSVR